MTLCSLEALQDLQHQAEFLKSITPRLYVLCCELMLDLAEIICHLLAITKHIGVLVFLENYSITIRRDRHHILLNIVDIHVALSKHISTLVNITLQEESYNVLVEALDFMLREEALLICDCLHEVWALLL